MVVGVGVGVSLLVLVEGEVVGCVVEHVQGDTDRRAIQRRRPPTVDGLFAVHKGKRETNPGWMDGLVLMSSLTTSVWIDGTGLPGAR